MEEVAVVVPVYQSHPSQKEMQCFLHNCNILSKHPIYLVAPEGLDLKAYNTVPNIKIEFFSPEFFKGLKGYNRFMLSEEFYSRFRDFKYILICQLDVWVFKDELLDWCSKDYDYIGAPWIDRKLTILQYILVKKGIWKTLKVLFTRNTSKCVGNGGFSLRKTATFLNSLKTNKKEAEEWKVNEDFYWSFIAKNNDNPLIVPDYLIASTFSIEVKPGKLMRLNNFHLPMAIHAWERYDATFWNEYLKKNGYES